VHSTQLQNSTASALQVSANHVIAATILWNLTEGPPGTWTRQPLLSTGRSISSFGQDSAGELYMLDLSGSVLKLVAQ
jgi:hypothetical protein